MSKYTTEQLQTMARHALIMPPLPVGQHFVRLVAARTRLTFEQVLTNINDLANGRTVH